MKKKLLAILAVIVCVTVLLSASVAHADFGGFSGDSDYGWDSGSDSDWGSSWGDDDGYSGGTWFWGGTSDGSDRDSGCTTGDMMAFMVVLIIIIIVLWFMRKNNAQHTPPSVTTSVQRTDDSELTPISRYTEELDPNFSVSQMQTKLSNLYVQLQDQWQAKDLTPLRPYLTDELYNQSERQLDEIVKRGRTPHVERIAVLGANVRGYFQRDGLDHIIVEMSTRITSYITDENGSVVSGDPNREKFMTYEWDLCRTSGLVTEPEGHMHSVNCPNCGAPITVNKSAKCPYCDTVITLDEHDWLLYSIKGLSQKTV